MKYDVKVIYPVPGPEAVLLLSTIIDRFFLMPPRRTPEEYHQSLLLLVAGHLFQLAAYAATLYYVVFDTVIQAYHTSALSGQGWIDELREGHELGVRKHIFNILLSELRWLGVGDSRYITLEEKLGIFLYTCTTGLPVRKVGERFQRSNETVSL